MTRAPYWRLPDDEPHEPLLLQVVVLALGCLGLWAVAALAYGLGAS